MASHSTPHVTTLPYWADSAALPTFAPIQRDLDVDVVVVGAGITGLTTAFLMAEAGRSVAVLERGTCGGVDTGHTSGHLTMVTDVRLGDLVRRFGKTHAQAVWDAGLAAMARIDAIVSDEQIDCGFERVDGYLHAPGGEADSGQLKALQDEASLASELGFDATALPHVPFIGGPGVRFEHQARMHPRQYLGGLVKAVRARKGQIYQHSAPRSSVEIRWASRRTVLGTWTGHRDCHAQSAGRRGRSDRREAVPDQAGAVHQLRGGRARAARNRTRRPLLGYRPNRPNTCGSRPSRTMTS